MAKDYADGEPPRKPEPGKELKYILINAIVVHFS
jgi:hypothetical protein